MSSEPLLSQPQSAYVEPNAAHGLVKPASQRHNRNWTPDRGAGFYQTERTRLHRAALVETGRHAGRSRVRYKNFTNRALIQHIWKRDFFTSFVQLNLRKSICIMVAVYLTSFLTWGCAWYILWRMHPQCIMNFKNYKAAFLFSTETQQTIGYGYRVPKDCWISAWMVAAQSIWAMLLNSVTLGIIFARISHPKQRGRTIFLSDSAVIARRDGVLKFMFRIADIRQTQVITPAVKGFLYTWAGYRTAEGEFLPVRVEPIELGSVDGLLVLPIIIEHTIDERSPLYGHTHDSLMALGAEVVVTFEGTAESGGAFMSRQSYLPTEIHWGYVFVPVVTRAPLGQPYHQVDLWKFHDIEPQDDLAMLPPGPSSLNVVRKRPAAVPTPMLQENTLVLSRVLALAPRNGQLCLMVRVGDSYEVQMIQAQVKAFLYRWTPSKTPEGETLPCEVHPLPLTDGVVDGGHVLLRAPSVLLHAIDERSPLASWRSGTAAMLADAESEILVTIEAVNYSTGSPALRQLTYRVVSDIKVGHHFRPIVRPPDHAASSHPRVDWRHFHDTESASSGVGVPGASATLSGMPHGTPRPSWGLLSAQQPQQQQQQQQQQPQQQQQVPPHQPRLHLQQQHQAGPPPPRQLGLPPKQPLSPSQSSREALARHQQQRHTHARSQDLTHQGGDGDPSDNVQSTSTITASQRQLLGIPASGASSEAIRRYTTSRDAGSPRSDNPTGSSEEPEDWHSKRSLSRVVFLSSEQLQALDRQEGTGEAPLPARQEAGQPSLPHRPSSNP